MTCWYQRDNLSDLLPLIIWLDFHQSLFLKRSVRISFRFRQSSQRLEYFASWQPQHSRNREVRCLSRATQEAITENRLCSTQMEPNTFVWGEGQNKLGLSHRHKSYTILLRTIWTSLHLREWIGLAFQMHQSCAARCPLCHHCAKSYFSCISPYFKISMLA